MNNLRILLVEKSLMCKYFIYDSHCFDKPCNCSCICSNVLPLVSGIQRNMNKAPARLHAVNIQNGTCAPTISVMIKYNVDITKLNKLISTKKIVLPRAFTFMGYISLSKVNGTEARPKAYMIVYIITLVAGNQTRWLVFI